MNNKIEKSYKEEVELKYQLYNSLFLSLDLEAVEQAGKFIPLLYDDCAEGLKKHLTPQQIIESFFEKRKPELSFTERKDFLFSVIQYIERQIVLIDALEDASYNSIHRVHGENSFSTLLDRAHKLGKTKQVAEAIKCFGLRVVLTAHPTQFYPSQVLGIITDLAKAIKKGKVGQVNNYLKQLGKTPFYQKIKPTPLNEANRLIYYLRNTFYPAIGHLLSKTAQEYGDAMLQNDNFITLGFWPGGDRDGNPYVTVDTTRKVAGNLRNSILECYTKDVKELRRRITFANAYEKVVELEKILKQSIENPELDSSNFGKTLDELIVLVKEEDLFVDKVMSLKYKFKQFGFHMASVDIRQDSRIIAKTVKGVMEKYPDILPANIFDLSESEQIDILLQAKGNVDANAFDDEIVKDTIASMGVIAEIQQTNGEVGAHRYIISNCRGAIDIVRVMTLFRLSGWANKKLTVDIVPLFETIDDLATAHEAMAGLYSNDIYRKHVDTRNNKQTIMLGFSDGTKDGGYLMANWSIYSAKENLTRVSRENDIEVVFFDGRGGPPARGGGNAHRFYAANGSDIESTEIQLTIQGQTISSHYGITEAAEHNLGYLISAGIANKVNQNQQSQVNKKEHEFIGHMADVAYKKYISLKEHELFVPYLEEISTLNYFGKANIGSRPSKRGGGGKLNLDDLRAIPFVGAWSQLKQNVPGYYGLGTALKQLDDEGKLDEVNTLYNNSLFFRTLIDNSMQSMKKTNFELTNYLKKNEKFGAFWQMLFDEYTLTQQMVLKISGMSHLLDDNPRSQMSIALREKVVLPLLMIQQYALMKIQQANEEGDAKTLEEFEKMVIRAMFGNINASRNSA